jgi:hypothetical protein
MSTLLTKGGLTPGVIKTIKGGASPEIEVKFMFNPSEYSLSKSSTWTETANTGLNVPIMSFGILSPAKLSLTLYFDTLDTRSTTGTYDNVRDYTFFLWKMMTIDPATVNEKTKKGDPYAVEFVWGKVSFKSVIVSLTENVTLFSETGTPLRANVKVDLQQHYDPSYTKPQDPTQPAWTSDVPKTSTFTAGTRLDLIAAFSGTAQSMRKIASDNGIDNPLNIPPGTNLLT